MIVTFYKNNSECARLDKSLTVTIENMIGTTKTELDILHPVLLLQFTTEAYNALLISNYFFITETKRYYFMDRGLTIQNNQLIVVSGAVDPLTSHKELIRNQMAVIRRQEKKYNLYYPDDEVKSTQNPLIQTIAFPSGIAKESSLVLVTSGGLSLI